MRFYAGGMAVGWLAVLCGSLTAAPQQPAEPVSDGRVFEVGCQVVTHGKLITQEATGKTRDLPLEATAQFDFRERRLPAAGRDALAYRAARQFATARLQAKIDNEASALELPAPSRLIVASGTREGIVNYSARTLLTRDLIDLLEVPGDPLALVAVLPAQAVDVGEEWAVAEWAAQMLSGVEAIESARLTGKVLAADAQQFRFSLTGSVQGLQEGAKTTVGIEGEVTFDMAALHLSAAKLTYRIQAEIGAVAPGIEAVVTTTLERRPASAAGELTDALVAAIPLDPPPQALQLVFEAGPWNARLRHDRGWYVFHAVFDAPPKVVILRLVEHGSLVCQCNFSPIPDAAPGGHTPLDEFEQDIQRVLGKSLRAITKREVSSLSDGRTLVEVIAQGEVEVTGKSKTDGTPTTLAIPLEWHYYIVSAASGRQMSFVFAVEQALLEQLAGRDRELVTSLEFLGQ